MENNKPPRKWTMFDRPVWDLFINPGEVVEVRILGVKGKYEIFGGDYIRGTVSGYFDDFERFSKAVKEVDRIPHGGIFFTLQVIDPRLIGRAFNRLKPAGATTGDSDVIAYRWLPVDLDPVRPSGISASDAELKAGLELREIVSEWMVKELAFPRPIKAISGNGGHILPRLPDMPVNKATQDFIKRTLEGLSLRFNTDQVKIDTSVFNPSRIWKLYGTTARKGDEVPAGFTREARPFRMAYIDDLGDG
jgi:hypothetical protein